MKNVKARVLNKDSPAELIELKMKVMGFVVVGMLVWNVLLEKNLYIKVECLLKLLEWGCEWINFNICKCCQKDSG